MLFAGLSFIRVTGNDPIQAASEAMEFRYKMSPESIVSKENILLLISL